ncbi:pepsin/retropepsin-like aspartic protease family protein [Hymenobacter sp. GOD-10R]|uniref:pepsin/retropepsin-like aspartic protease family protein n=1 Tax=Hymenobacter sp. GOD-10R TaxID=3093922 RepID=UPI002D77AD20|nr:pepsin/retropepsin-like aspartic protease family protein [Hymenobacter sp. GOD-10R]WRQ26722.1 pepsin/retropepsin-like aspartic protease family protein [Hymenobacter sp. GOD-10R]
MTITQRIACYWVLACWLWSSGKLAQASPLPVLHATARAVSIRDGAHFQQNVWQLDPTAQPDCYYPELPCKPHLVVFITDQDSLTIPVSYGKHYDFIIVLNQRDSCYTRIVATEQGISTYSTTYPHPRAVPDTLPFTLRGSRIYLTGLLNNTHPVSIQFDLGAGLSCINQVATSSAGVRFDGQTTLNNSDGMTTAPTSSANQLTIGRLTWNRVPLVQSRNMQRDEDLIIGNSLFQNKVVEIDYDRRRMLLYDTLPRLGAGYSRHALIYIQHRPLVQATVTLGGQPYTGWFLFDTGRDGTMVLRDDFFRQHPGSWPRLHTLLPMGRKHVVVVPQVQLGDQQFTDVVCPAFNPSGPDLGSSSLLGNELLSHFNVVLDNQNGYLYLRPNSLQQHAYTNWNTIKLWGLAGAVGLLSVLLGSIAFWRGRQRRLTLT